MNPITKPTIDATRSRIIQKVQERLGITIDTPTSNGGNTNDGNTARIFFNNIDVILEITGIFIF